MHSIILLGDPRTHVVKVSSNDWKPEEIGCSGDLQGSSYQIAGGVYLMRQAILQMARECGLWRTLPEKKEDACSSKLKAELRRILKKAGGKTLSSLRKHLVEDTLDDSELDDGEDGRLTFYLASRIIDACDTPISFQHDERKKVDQETINRLTKELDIVSTTEHLYDRRRNRLLYSVRVDYRNMPENLSNEVNLGEVVSRRLVPKPVPKLDNKKQKAKIVGTESEKLQSRFLPDIDARLARVLSNEKGEEGQFEFQRDDSDGKTKRLAHVLECPDVVVIDDLNWYFREIVFEIDRDSADIGAGNDERERLRWYADAPRKYDEKRHDRSRIDLHKAMLSQLWRRFAKAREKSEQTCFSALEPIIFGSIRTKPSAVFPENPDYSTSGKRSKGNFWFHLVEDPWLRQRSVVLLDAEDLRDDGLAISTGLSWERTAQDTISQLRHSMPYRQFLRFGTLIVRFGVTGALRISNLGDSQRVCTLFFDPENDDAAWDSNEQNGSVLGNTAVYAAHFVKSLQQECRKKDGGPSLEQLDMAIRTAIIASIRSCQVLSRTGYGENDWVYFTEAIKSCEYLPRGLFCDGGECKETDTWQRRKTILRVDDQIKQGDIQVASASIPPSLQRQWSILTQSALVGEMGIIAAEIVKQGPDQVFNLTFPSNFPAARQELSRHLLDAISNYKKTHHGPDDRPDDGAWLLICQAAIDLFNSSSTAPTHKLPMCKLTRVDSVGEEEFLEAKKESRTVEDARDLETAWKQLLEHWHKLNPKEEAWVSGRYWQHLEGVKSDPAFEHILVTTGLGPLGEFKGIKAANRDHIVAPLIKFGETAIVDRREVEGFRAIEKLMKEHLKKVRDGKNERPLSIAIFGPPGSGKSRAVKEINKSLEDDNAEVLPAFNLGEFTSVKDLEQAFEKISTASKKVPIAFFDEFDSRYSGTNGSEELGWLKFFLAPMEDGRFRGKPVENAILVFAGGTSQTFADFSLANRSHSDENWIRFSRAKGPDFASRLSGYLDIVGINTTGPEDELFMIRRGMVIRSLLEQMQKLKPGHAANIEDERMLPALLKVPLYRNGVRSVRMMLELCSDRNGRISPSEIPPIHQLNMHVDGKAFLDLLQ